MNPKVRLIDIWNKLTEGGIAKNLLPTGIVKRTATNIRFNTRVISLFDDEF